MSEVLKIGSLLFGADEAVKLWVRDRSNTTDDFSNGAAIGVVRNGSIIFGLVFYNYRTCGPSLELAFAADSPRWATKENIHHLLSYPFMQLDCERVTGQVVEDNARSRRFSLGMGFKEEGRIRKASHGKDVIIYGLLKEEFINGKFGKAPDRQAVKPEPRSARTPSVEPEKIGAPGEVHDKGRLERQTITCH